MKYAIKILTVAFIALVTQTTFAGKWYVGGTLHKANASQWRNSTHENRLSTAADWAAVLYEGRFNNMKELRPFAFGLVTCINEATSDSSIDSITQSVSKVAAFCTVLIDAQ